MEIEISPRLLKSGLVLLLIIGPLLAGMNLSPTQNERPLLLTPRLANLNAYQHSVQTWVRTFRQVDASLSDLLVEDPTDLFAQNERLNRYYQQMNLTLESLDRTAVPTTMEPFHELLVNTANAYLDATILTARWISEPSPENAQAANTALSSAEELLQRLYANPWIEVQP